MTSDDISQYLESLEREDNYRVDAVLKESDIETTQRVFFRTENNAENGPYIRKFINRDSGLGGAYERIYRANLAGMRFVHIPNVHEYYLHDENVVVVMEHVNGPTLADVVYEEDPSLQLASQLFGGLCDAVSELHTQFTPPLIHRDLKPSNIIVRNGEPVIIDFGIARDYNENADTDTTHFGTRAYAPPEQYGYGQTTERSDVYALGMLLYFLLVEETPNPHVIQQGFNDNRIPEPLQQVIVQATAFDPAKRFASAAALKEAFGSALVQSGAAAHISSPNAPAPAEPADATPMGAPVIVVDRPIIVQAPTGQTTTPPPAVNPSSNYSYDQPVPPQAPPSPFGLVRNIVIALFCVLLVVSSVRIGLDPTSNMAAYHPFVRHSIAFVLVPIVFMGVAYLLMDKQHLAHTFPILQKVSERQVKVFFLLAFLIPFFLVLLICIVFNIPTRL